VSSCFAREAEQRRASQKGARRKSTAFHSPASSNYRLKQNPEHKHQQPIPKVRFLGDSLDRTAGEAASTSVPDIPSLVSLSTKLPTTKHISSSYHEPATTASILDSSQGLDKRRLRRDSSVTDLKLANVENPVQKELELLREAFQTQVFNLRNKNQDLEKRVDLLEGKGEQEKLAIEETAKLKDKIVSIESENTILRNENEMYEQKIREIEEERQEMYYIMFKKGQQAAAQVDTEDRIIDQMTEDRIALKFLHDAFYYFLMNKGNSREHIQAMMTMLNFTNAQKEDVYRRRGKSS
jgi:hypothetical protein